MKIDIRPVFRGDFDRYDEKDRGKYQIRINIWGFSAYLIYKFMAMIKNPLFCVKDN